MQVKEGIFNKKKRKRNYICCGKTDEQRPGNQSSRFYAELMRICKLIQTEMLIIAILEL